VTLALAWSLTAVSAPVFAQSTAQQSNAQGSDETGASLQTVVVYAQKRQQALGDVGVPIVIATADDLQSAGVTDITSLGKIAPGFTAARTQTGYQVFSIRGVNFDAQQIAAPPTVSTYIDEAPLPYPAMYAGLLLDVDHVEVLKGPQGTLYGQNATGGSVNVIAARPTTYLSGMLQQSLNDFGESVTDGYISGPISDTLLGRFAFTTTHGGAWQEGYFANHFQNGAANRGAARLLFDWTPGDIVKLSVMFNANYDDGEPQALQLQEVAPQNPAGAAPGLLTYPLPPQNNRAADWNTPYRLDNYLYQGVIRADINVADTVTLTSLTDYIENRQDQAMDNDATGINVSSADHLATARSINQEVRVTGHPVPSVTYIAGVNYQHDDFASRDLTHLTEYSSLPGTTIDTHFDQGNRAAGVFGNVDWEIRSGLTLTAGVRYTWTRQTASGCSTDTGDGSLNGFVSTISNALRAAQGLPPTNAFNGTNTCSTMNDVPAGPGGLASFLPTSVKVAQEESNVPWRVGLNYKPTADSLLYALVSRGFKAGVFPFQDTLFVSQSEPVRQEQLTDYEVGYKAALLDQKLNVDVSAYYYDYLNKQFYSFIQIYLVGQAPTLVNIPTATARGADLGLTAQLATGLRVRGGITYLDSRIGPSSGSNLRGQVVDLTGKAFNFAPKWTGTLDVEYRFPVSKAAEMFIGGSMLYNSQTYSDLANSAPALIGSYTTFDARIGAAGKRWSVSLWGRNLANRYYWTSVGVAADVLFRYTGLPRMYGGTVSYKF